MKNLSMPETTPEPLLSKEVTTVPFLTKTVLMPARSVYVRCSEYTRNHFTALSAVLTFTILVCGTILGVSLSTFGFNGALYSYCITIPIAVLLYWSLDRLVVMADAKAHAAFIKRSRYVVAIVFGLLNSFLIDSLWYANDIKAEREKEIVIVQSHMQSDADSLSHIHQLHKADLYSQIEKSAASLKQRNDALVQEAEGGSISGHVGQGPIYAAKLSAYRRDSTEFARVNGLMLAEAAKDDSLTVRIQADVVEKKKNAHLQVSTGINKSMELLHRVIFSSATNILVALLLLIAAMILELLPLLAKHYIDISEYFTHAKDNVDIQLATAPLRKTNAITSEEHQLGLQQKETIATANGKHRVKMMKQEMAFQEQMLYAADNHFSIVTEKEAAMRTRYPQHFSEHLQPFLQRIYHQFTVSHGGAFANN